MKEGFLAEREELGCGGFYIERLRGFPSGELFGVESGVIEGEGEFHGVGESVSVMGWDEPASLIVRKEFDGAAGFVCADGGHAGSEAFDQGEAPAIVAGGEAEDGAFGKGGGHFGPRLEAEPFDLAGAGGEGVAHGRFEGAGADEDKLGVGMFGGDASEGDGDEVGAFAFGEATGEEEDAVRGGAVREVEEMLEVGGVGEVVVGAFGAVLGLVTFDAELAHAPDGDGLAMERVEEDFAHQATHSTGAERAGALAPERPGFAGAGAFPESREGEREEVGIEDDEIGIVDRF